MASGLRQQRQFRPLEAYKEKDVPWIEYWFCVSCGFRFTLTEWEERHYPHDDSCLTTDEPCYCSKLTHSDCCHGCAECDWRELSDKPLVVFRGV